MTALRVAVFGAGAVGGHLAARLAHAGHRVSVVVRADTAAVIRRQGLRLETGGQAIEAAVAASDDPQALGPQDLVLVTVKATALAAASTALDPLVEAGTRVVFVQNGLPWWYGHGLPGGADWPELRAMDPQGRLAGLLRAGQALGAVILSSNTVLSPGVVRNVSPGRNVLQIGEIAEVPGGGESDRVRELRSVFAAAGCSAPEVRHLRKAVWQKLLLNLAGSSLCTLTRRDVSVIARDAALGDVFETLVREAMAIAAAHGVHFDAGEVDIASMRAGSGSTHRPSMLQDFESGRVLETDAILRAPQRCARDAGVPTPVLDTVLALLDRAAADRG